MTLKHLAILLLALAAPAAAEEGSVRINDDLQVEELGDGLWLHVSYDEVPDFGRSPGNGMVVVSGTEAALLDTPWTDELTEQLFAWIAETLGARVTPVVVTHSHQDCLGGLAAAHRLGARSYAYEKTVAFARETGKEVPQHAFADDFEVRVGERTLVLRHLGGGHAVDNSVVWVPDAKTLFGGCLVRAAASRSLGYTGEADMAAWQRTIRRLLDEHGDARRIVPGHGSPGGRELLERTLELLAALDREDGESLVNTIRWATASEVDNFGFDVYRSEREEGPFVRINPEIVEGAGTTDEPQSYELVDDTIDPHKTYYYYVESISMSGQRERFTPVGKAPPKVRRASEPAPPSIPGGDGPRLR
jgi:metallo-beta-lactamase class B